MKAGSFNIHDYLGKLYEKIEENDLDNSLNKEQPKSNLSNKEGIIIPEEGKKAYDWLKKEYQKGKTEVKVEMSSYEFKPGYHLDTTLKSVNDFKPGMYGNVKTSENEKNKKEKNVPFPETKFPSLETKSTLNNKKENYQPEKKTSGIKLEIKGKKEKND